MTSEFWAHTGPLISLATGAQLAEQVFNDSGAGDVVRIAADGRRTRLTSAVGDDVPYSWSPDGRFVAFSSSRWSAARQHHAAILEVATGRVRPVGRGDGLEDVVLWSPDGSRLIFTRRFLDGRPAERCLVAFDGHDERCQATGLPNVDLNLGWLDAAHLLVDGALDDGVPGVYSLAVDSAWKARLLVAGTWMPSLSPNRKWLAWRTANDAHGEVRVAPMADLARVRTVPIDQMGTMEGPIGWATHGKAAPFIDGLSFDARSDTLYVGVPHRAEVVAHWSGGGRSAAARLSWSVDDTARARVDSLGIIVARRAGPIAVTASAGGWRMARRTFVAIARRDSLVAQEDWTHGLGAWRLFGNPDPRVVDDADLAHALSNEGDGTYFSGAYFRRLLDGRRGLAIDARVRTPLTEYQWQSLSLGLHAFNDPATLARWDHRSGYLPWLASTSGLAACSAQYPRFDGVEGRGALAVAANEQPRADFDRRRLAQGDVWRLRLQLFPDGRCGVAVNGRPVATSDERMEAGIPLLLVTYGNSWRSRMLLGPLTIREGVPGDIDWTAVDSGQASRPHARAGAPARTTPRPPE